MRACWVAAVLCASGCDKLFGVLPVPDAADGVTVEHVDALQPICLMPPNDAAQLCADFDEANPTLYVNKTPTSLSLMAPALFDVATAPTSLPAPSLPNALSFRSHGGDYFPMLVPPGKFSTMTAEFDLLIEDRGTNRINDVGLVRLAGEGSGLGSCYFDLVLVQSDPAIRLNDECGPYDYRDVFPHAVPTGWLHLTFVFDLVTPQASVDVNHSGTPTTLPFTYTGTNAPPLDPYIAIGLGSSGAQVGLVVAFDNLVVTTN